MRIRWAFTIATALFAAAVFGLAAGGPDAAAMPTPAFLIALPLWVVAQNVLADAASRRPRYHVAGAWLCLAGDLVLLSAAVHGTGGVASWLWALYPFVTLEAAFLTRSGRATAAAAIAGVGAYALVQGLERGGWIVPAETAFTVDEQGRPLAYLAAKIAWVAVVNGTATFAGLTALAAIDRSRAALEDAYGRLARQYEDLREVDRLKGGFLAMVSSELRTPLTLAGGYAELAEDDPGLTDEGRSFLAETSAAIAALSANVDLMIAYTTLADPGQPMRHEPVRAREVVEQVFEAHEAACRVAGLVLMHDEPPDDVRLEGDGARLAAAVGELVANARRATPSGGTIGLRVAVGDGRVAFEVWDTGAGVPARVRARLLEGFPSPDALIAEQGPGLGLAYAHLVARRHGGALEIDAPHGGGAVVRLCVPTLVAGGGAPRPRVRGEAKT